MSPLLSFSFLCFSKKPSLFSLPPFSERSPPPSGPRHHICHVGFKLPLTNPLHIAVIPAGCWLIFLSLAPGKVVKQKLVE